jgi:hypothetical protein
MPPVFVSEARSPVWLCLPARSFSSAGGFYGLEGQRRQLKKAPPSARDDGATGGAGGLGG